MMSSSFLDLAHNRRMAVMLASLWWGGLSGIAFVAVPALFAQLASPAVAGPVAAWLFAFVCKLSLVSAGMLLARQLLIQRGQAGIERNHVLLWALRLALVAALVQDHVVAQQIVTARDTGGNLKLWHGLGSVLVLAQWLGAGFAIWQLTRSHVNEKP